MVKNIISKNLGKVQIDEIYPHKNVRLSKGPDGLNIRGNIYIDDSIGIGTEYTDNTNIKILGNMVISGLNHNNTLLNIINNINNAVFRVTNKNIYINGNQIINGNLISSNIYSNNLLKVPVYNNITNSLINQTGSIIFNKSSNTYEGYDNNKWSILGGINPNEDTIIKQNLTIQKNINVLDSIITPNLISTNILRIPVYDNLNNKNNILNSPGSIIFNKSSNTYEGYDNNRWSTLGGINPYEDIIIKHNLIVNKNINILSNLNALNNIIVSGNLIGNLIGTSSIAYNLINVLNISKGGTGLNILGNKGQILQVKEDLSGLEWKDVSITTPAKSNQFLKKLSGLYDNRSIDSFILTKPNIETLNNYYIWKLLENYKPTTNTKQIIITVNFTFIDINLTSNIKLEFYINSDLISNQTIEEKVFTGNQKKNINKIYILNLDGVYKDLVWNEEKTIYIKVTDLNNSGNIKLFTYDGLNVNEPKIIIEELGDHDGSIALRENLIIKEGSIENTPIGLITPSSGSFSNILLNEGNIKNINNIVCNSIDTNNISNGLSINFNGNSTKNIINLKNNLEDALHIINNNDIFLKIKTIENENKITIYKDIIGHNLVLNGNLSVNGNTNIISTTNTIISDNIIELNNGTTTPINDSGILINRGSEQNSFIGWDESEDKFIMGSTNSNSLSTGNLEINKGTLLANIEGNIIGNLNGNALTSNHSLTCDTATNLADILPIIRGGTGLNTTGTEGQILQVINNNGDLDWKLPTAYNSPMSYQILETLTGLYDNRSIKDYNLLNQNIQLLNNNYEWTIISNYIPPTNTKQIIFNIEFSLYDTNLNTYIKIEFIINNNIISKQTSEEKFFSANQKKNIHKIFIINLDGAYKDLDWISNNNVIIKITDLYDSNNIKLFTYDGNNINYPKITIQSIGIEPSSTTIDQNLVIDNGSINNTKIGTSTGGAEEAAFTSIDMNDGNIMNTNDINCINLITNNINTINFSSTNLITPNINSTNITSNDITLTTPLSISSGGTGISTIGTSGQVLYVNSSGTSLEWKMIPQRSLQTNQILENLIGIYDNRTIKTYVLNEPTIVTLNNSYEWIALNNYLPPTNSKEILFNFEFNLYDNNLNTLIKIEYKIGDSFIDNQISEEKIFSANQQKTIQQCLIIKLDGVYKDLDWNSNYNVIVKITDLNNTGNIKLFTYDGINLKRPKINIQAIGENLGDISINQNLTINDGVINNTPIGELIPSTASFTNVNVSGTLTNFTGSHIVNFNNPLETHIGLIVITSDYLNYEPNINNNKINVELSTISKSPNIFGVISRKYNNSQVIINSIGEGGIWVCNLNGNFNNGDYIQTSNILGLGEKQDNNILYNYTVAKILHNCDFNLNNEYYNCKKIFDNKLNITYIKAFVACSYHCG